MAALSQVYRANVVLLLCHQIDSAYWHEWELFHLPGGETLFVWHHVPLIWLMVHGAVLLHRRMRAGAWYALVLAVAGVAGGVIHGAFLLGGSESFRTASSIILIVAFSAVSLVQLALSIRALRAPVAE